MTIIAAAVVAAAALSSPLVNREIAWTTGSSTTPGALGTRVRFADTSALFAAVDRYVQEQMHDGRVPGLALAIVHGGRIVHTRGFGVAAPSGRPVTPETPFILGSLSKSFTATAVLQLVDQGRVQLDAPVQQYLPWFNVRDHRASARITVRQLLNHTSGIPRSAGMGLVRGEEAVTPKQQERLMARVRLSHAPGKTFEYSNANYWLLGLVVEAVTGTSYGAYVQSHIFAPLHLTGSFTSEMDAERAGLAEGHRVWFGIPRPEELPFYWRELAVGYLISDATDMATYLIAQSNPPDSGASLLSAQSLREMQTPPPGLPYAMGWLTAVVDRVPVLWHTGAVANYHGDMLLIPSTGWGVVQLANTNNFVLEGQLSAGIQGIAALLLGYEPPPISWPAFRTSYALIALACVLWLAWRVVQLTSLPDWRRSTFAPGGPPQLPSLWHPTRVLIDPGVSLGLLAAVPMLVGSPLSTLRWFVPDLTDWMIANAVIATLVMTTRLALSTMQQRPASDER